MYYKLLVVTIGFILKLRRLETSMWGHWLIVGDFNKIIDGTDRSNGNVN